MKKAEQDRKIKALEAVGFLFLHGTFQLTEYMAGWLDATGLDHLEALEMMPVAEVDQMNYTKGFDDGAEAMEENAARGADDFVFVRDEDFKIRKR
jgi:hypothetical protein